MITRNKTKYGNLSEIESEQLVMLLKEYSHCLKPQEMEEMREKIASFAGRVASRSYMEGHSAELRSTPPYEARA